MRIRSGPNVRRANEFVHPKNLTKPRLAIYFLVFGSTLWGQNGRINQISNNRGKVVVTVKTDREVYFPEEVGQLTITITNPTAKDLEIWKPFVKKTGTVILLQKGGVSARAYGIEYGPVSPGLDVIPVSVDDKPPPLPPTEVIRRGEQLTRTLWFYDTSLGEDDYVIGTGGAPLAGDYRVGYWGKSADFRVVAPVFEGLLKINLHEFRVAPPSELVQGRVELRTYAFVLGYGDKHFVCVQRVPGTHAVDRVTTDEQGRVSDSGLGLRELGLYSRFAESDEPIRSLRGESDAAGNLLLAWQQGDEERHLNLARTDWEIKFPTSGQ